MEKRKLPNLYDTLKKDGHRFRVVGITEKYIVLQKLDTDGCSKGGEARIYREDWESGKSKFKLCDFGFVKISTVADLPVDDQRRILERQVTFAPSRFVTRPVQASVEKIMRIVGEQVTDRISWADLELTIDLCKTILDDGIRKAAKNVIRSTE